MSKNCIGYKKEEILKKCGQELSLSDIQNRLYQMMVSFDDFCRDHELKYCIAYGTLIGAVRHKGFIPWDDDVDFYMPREDYEKLMEYHQLSDDFLLVNMFRHNDYYYPYAYGNIVDAKSIMVANNMDLCTGKGLSIDILPVDRVPGEGSERQKYIKEIMRLRRLVDLIHGRRFNNRGIRYSVKRCIARVLSLLNEDELLIKIDKAAKKYIDKGYEDSAQLILATPRVYPLHYFTNPIELEFRGRMFYAPANYDSMLTEMYGDYMTPPPEKDRYNHNMHVYWLNSNK